jgi:pilus assembly protein Flp/PilA
MQAFVAFLSRLVREEEGQDMVEYALILGLVSIVAVIAVTATGTAVNDIWTAVQSAVEGAIP